MKHSTILNIILASCLLLLLIKLNGQANRIEKSSGFEESIKVRSASGIIQDKNIDVTHQVWVKLTVAESKRLISKGLVIYPPVSEKLKAGRVIIARGSTNTYIAEEILNDSILPGAFVTGRITPAKGDGLKYSENRIPEIIIHDGERIDMAFAEALDATSNLDIVFKGANIINYTQKKAAVLIGNSTGGTIGQILPRLKDDKIRLIVPVGLEKNSSWDLLQIAKKLQLKPQNIGNKVPELWILPGELFTEIEAIQQFADVEVTQIGSGGIAGAEGGVVLAIRGPESEVQQALTIVESIQGEPAFH